MGKNAMAVPSVAGSNWASLKKKLPPPVERDVKRKPKRITGLSNLAKNFERTPLEKQGESSYDLLGTWRLDLLILPMNRAGPSKVVEINVPAPVTEGVVITDIADARPLVRELRDMVSGRNFLTEAKKAPGNYDRLRDGRAWTPGIRVCARAGLAR
ncbi:hypothetical protein P7C73_g5975, partial [Tremellales sp. Uapishka_1]